MSYTAFDIEIAKQLPDGETDWHAHRPLGLSCAATYSEGVIAQPGLLTKMLAERYWFSGPLRAPDERVNVDDLNGMVDFLLEAQDTTTRRIVTWNGLWFDFDILAEETGRFEECSELALNHVDMMFHFFCLKGFPLGLNTAAKGMGLAGKTEGMSGALAPQYWRQGRCKEVLEYCMQDVRTTLELAVAVEDSRRLAWTSKANKPCSVSIPQWLTVREALELPEPDTSWMDKPWPRSKFTSWLEG